MVDIDTMPAGREMDALIAGQVMGWQHLESPSGEGLLRYGPAGIGLPLELLRFSTNIAAAWTLVERLKLCVWPTNDGRYFVFQDEFSAGYGDEYWFGGNDFPRWWETIADTAPLAICRAALKATEAANG